MDQRFAIYTRQSIEPRDGLSSCEGQFDTCLRFANAETGERIEWIGERFDDEGVSGRTLNRPALNRLRELAKSGAIQRVYATALDRYSRNVVETIQLLEEFERAGIEVHIAQQPVLVAGPESRLLRHILASFAQFEREMIATRIAETRAYLKKHGRRLAGPAPYGYDSDPTTKQLVPNRIEARRVRAIFKRAAGGQTPAEIARPIDHLGWRTKQWKSKRSGRLIGGGRWTARQVLDLLRNPVYTGRFADKGKIRDGCHKPVIDHGTFDAVQRQLDGRRSTTAKSRQRASFPLRNKIVCPKCGRRLCTYVVTRRLGPNSAVAYRYYRCRSSAGGRAPCRGVQYPSWAVEQFIREQLVTHHVWQNALAAANSDGTDSAYGHADRMRAAWAALDITTQDRLLPGIVESIEFRRRNSEMRITLSTDLADAIMPILAAPSDESAHRTASSESGHF